MLLLNLTLGICNLNSNMFENLTKKVGEALRNLGGKKKLTEANIRDALKEVRQALLSADVHFTVVKKFIKEVESRCIGIEIINSVSAHDQVVKIINDELINLLKSESNDITKKKQIRIMMIGLHGSGKTTSSVKLAKLLKKKYNYNPALVACDIYRPAAIDQLQSLSNSENFFVYADRNESDISKIALDGIKQGENKGADCFIFDTAGRLQIDENLISEIKKLKISINPDEVFLVADAALGQEAVNISKSFNDSVSCTGIILTKLDGDARGGSALSMKSITNVPLKFVGLGEKIDDFDYFHADRVASRILGMGDVVTLVEKAQENIDQIEAENLAKRIKNSEFNFDDFYKQIQHVKKIGSMGSIASMLPGMSDVKVGNKEEKKMQQSEAIICSMTKKERENPRLIRGRRLMRISKGSGTQVRDVNALLKQFSQMQKMMKMMRGNKGSKMLAALKNKMGNMNL